MGVLLSCVSGSVGVNMYVTGLPACQAWMCKWALYPKEAGLRLFSECAGTPVHSDQQWAVYRNMNSHFCDRPVSCAKVGKHQCALNSSYLQFLSFHLSQLNCAQLCAALLQL